MINRTLTDKMTRKLGLGKILVILGARQVGKTTLAKMIAENAGMQTIWLNGDEPDVRDALSNKTSTQLKALIGSKELVIIDEAQRIQNIGLTLKLLVDNFKEVQVIATGSSSLDLANEINEPLTGRKNEYNLFPLSFNEMSKYTDKLTERRLLEHRLLYGYYPEVVINQGKEKEVLSQITDSYLYKDIFTLETIKKPLLLEKLLQALALQLGNEVSTYELSQLIGIDSATVERYIDLLEKTFVIYRLSSLNRNMRNEIKKGKKIYFYDTGIRNAIIKNFSPINMRQDVGALWENFLINERMKLNHYSDNYLNRYFWRTHAQQEIDYIEEYDGNFYAYEFKWNPKRKVKFSKSFVNAYPNSETSAINTENFQEFIQ